MWTNGGKRRYGMSLRGVDLVCAACRSSHETVRRTSASVLPHNVTAVCDSDIIIGLLSDVLPRCQILVVCRAG
jgi:hypothetical protein